MNRILLAFVLMIAASVCAAAQSDLYYPHIVNGPLGGHVYKTTIFLTNPAANGSGAISGNIVFYRHEEPRSAPGTALSLTFTSGSGDVLTGSSIPFQLAGGQSVKFVSSGTGAFAQGFAIVQSTGSVSGTATFADFDSAGRLTAEAGVPAVQAVPRQTIFIDTVGGYNVGVAYANPGADAASVTLTLLNSSGVTVATTVQTLGAKNHAAAFTDGLFTASPIAPLAGTMQIVSAQPLPAIALRYDPTLTIFTTLPPVTIASLLSPTVNWLEKRQWLQPLTSVARLLGSLAVRLG